VAARLAVAAVALVLVGWLGVMERDAHLQARGVEAARPPQAAGDLERAASDLRAARLLNPDTAPDVLRAFVLQAAGEDRAAVALVGDVVRREPDNLDAWGVLYTLTRQRDPATAQRALAARQRLDPVRAR
jgi:hypothetical protein